MSAFLVGKYHIDCLLTYATNRDAWLCIDGVYTGGLRKASRMDLSSIGQILIEQNQRSVNERYNESDQAEGYEYTPIFRNFRSVEILKACNCYDYQACETNDYYQTNAAKIIDAIRHTAISHLPGYDDAGGWEFVDPQLVKKE